MIEPRISVGREVSQPADGWLAFFLGVFEVGAPRDQPATNSSPANPMVAFARRTQPAADQTREHAFEQRILAEASPFEQRRCQTPLRCMPEPKWPVVANWQTAIRRSASRPHDIQQTRRRDVAVSLLLVSSRIALAKNRIGLASPSPQSCRIRRGSSIPCYLPLADRCIARCARRSRIDTMCRRHSEADCSYRFERSHQCRGSRRGRREPIQNASACCCLRNSSLMKSTSVTL